MKTLLKEENQFSEAAFQVKTLENTKKVEFSEKLRGINLFPLKPTAIEILQINLGKLCNQVCEHCHVDAGPDRKEIMIKDVLLQCLEAAKTPTIHTVDLTGGAPEMNPDFRWFVSEMSQLGKKVIVRSNLTILTYKKYLDIPQFYADNKVTVVSSMPCYSKDNVDKQRGDGVFERSIQALQRLNEVGYGKEGSGLELDLVFNPGGASLPPEQIALELDYKRELKVLFNIEFNSLYTITNLPISRFLGFLIKEGKYEEYMNKLIESFNPSAAESVMCRNTVSVGWDGKLFDCDFNQMLELGVASKSQHISNFDSEELKNRNIILGQHCYGCAAGSGSSCQGSLA
ncbi:MAG: arsenosugar biosynthesis radical SAM protein ArsS [Flavobacteriales bacterium]|tara:strand:- start:6371 stop:7399 length:1029 start_codon:yes stop_codon:yes gene_type:complete